MSRELAGVIACIQEIELACDELECRENLSSLHLLPMIKEKIRNFYTMPSADGAQEIERSIVEMQAGRRVDESDETVFNASLKVDGVQTDLLSLCEELREVLEDLG